MNPGLLTSSRTFTPVRNVEALVDDALAPLRGVVGKALRSRVAGADANERAAVIWGKEGERWFTPHDPVWRVHADASMFPGGIASLLMQSLHPLAMAGVNGHSGYKSDPWGRLQRTSNYIAATTFGTIETAQTQIARVRSIHDRVRGRDQRGRSYSASDPHLLMWVHICEIMSFLRAYQAYAHVPLSPSDADLYVFQAGVSARELGVADPPQSTRELDEIVSSYRPELEGSPQAREVARFLLLSPPVPWPMVPGYAAVALGGLGVLPAWVRRELAIPMPPASGSLVARPAGAAATSVIRWAMSGLDDTKR